MGGTKVVSAFVALSRNRRPNEGAKSSAAPADSVLIGSSAAQTSLNVVTKQSATSLTW